MSFWFFAGAGALSAIWCLVHLFFGGRDIAQPLLQAPGLDPIVRDTQYLCWHFTSVSIACMAGLFLWSATTGIEAFAVAGTSLATGFAIVGIALVKVRKGRHLELPQGWLFVPVAILGLVGILS